jgi:hypothetical protein
MAKNKCGNRRYGRIGLHHTESALLRKLRRAHAASIVKANSDREKVLARKK